MKILSPKQLLVAIPHLLGFHPDSSLLLVAMQDDEVEVMMRCDLAELRGKVLESSKQAPDSDETGHDLVQRFRNNLEGLNEPGIVLVVYSSEFVDRQLLAPIETALADVALLDILCVTDSHWKSLLCDDLQCCPQSGNSVDFTEESINAEFVILGSAPFSSRHTLSQSLEAVELDSQACDSRDEAFSKLAEHGLAAASTETVEEMVHLITSGQDLSWMDVARVCQSLADFHYRDAILKTFLDDVNHRVLARQGLTNVLKRCPSRWVAPVATTLAGIVWLDGNGALSRLAIDRALEADGDYSLARLLDRALEHGVPPRVWAESLAAVSFQECVNGAA